MLHRKETKIKRKNIRLSEYDYSNEGLYFITVSNIIKKYKEWVTKQIKETIWQKSFYDHIIRNEKDYLRIWKYIDENILKWSLDKYYNE